MKRILIATVAALALAACSQQPTVAEVADAAGNGSVALMKEANSTTGAFVSSTTVTTLGNLRDLADKTGVLPSLKFLPQPVTRAMESVSTGTTTTTSSSVDDRADALGKFFRERIFTEANLESSGKHGLVFRIKGEDVCGDGVTPDTTCEASFDRFEVRIRVTRDLISGFDFYLELGPDRVEPVFIMLGKEHIGVGVDLGAVKAAVEYVDSVTGQPVYTPKTMEGVFTLQLIKNGDQDFTLSSAVTKAIKVEGDGENGPVSFATEAKQPWFNLRLQAKQKSASLDLDLGATDVSFPYKPYVSATGLAGHQMALHLGGLSGSVALSASALSLNVENIGLGDSQTTLSLDGTNLLKVDLNPHSGRRFNVSVGLGSDHQLQIKVDPELDLTTVFFYQPLQADTDVTIPPYAVDSTYTFQFTGDSPTLEPASNGFKVVSGTLRLENQAHADQAVVVEPGRCLVPLIPAGTDPLIGGYVAQDCL